MTPQKFIVGRYTLGDETALWKLYVATTHNVVSRDYTPAQCQRWAPADKDMAEWWLQVQSRNPFVVRTNGGILGFAELEETGHIDHFYVHHQWQGKGVGRALYEAVETEAVRLQLPLLFTESSVTAMPFFVRMGFDVMEEQAPIVCGAPAKQFLMRKPLTI